MPGREQKNNPGNYAADLWENQLDQTRRSPGKRRGKNGTVLINGVAHVQSTLFHGEELRAPFPDVPVNKIPDRLGMTDDPGTLFSRPTTEPQSSQNELFSISTEPASETPHLPAAPEPGKKGVPIWRVMLYYPETRVKSETLHSGGSRREAVEKALRNIPSTATPPKVRRAKETAQRPFTEIHRNPTIIKKDTYRREKMKRKMQKDSRRRNRGK